jgi:hypothetical protein
MKTSDAVNNAIRILIKQGSAKNTKKWQAVDVKTNLVEISNVFFKMDNYPIMIIYLFIF